MFRVFYDGTTQQCIGLHLLGFVLHDLVQQLLRLVVLAVIKHDAGHANHGNPVVWFRLPRQVDQLLGIHKFMIDSPQQQQRFHQDSALPNRFQ